MFNPVNQYTPYSTQISKSSKPNELPSGFSEAKKKKKENK